MDRTDPQVARFAATLAAIDDDTLAALANKGLVRRARKDIEKSPPAIAEADDVTVSLEMEGCTVRLANPPGKSTCTCASGICRHILGAFIWLRENAAAPAGTQTATAAVKPPDGPSVTEQLLAMDEAAVQAWAGKPLFRRATTVLSRGYEVEESPVLLVRLPAQNVTVRLLGTTPEAMICSCHAPGACEHKVAAVAALVAHKTGKRVQVPQSVLEASAGAPRSREEVRLAVLTLIREMVTLGLSRVSDVTRQRLATLATSAHGVDLPRLERMIKTLADEVSATLARDAAASSAAMLATCSRIAALCTALKHPTPALVGEHRSEYMPVSGSMELVGLGARRWRSKSGYHGLTVFFWEPARRRWTGWTDARPAGTPGFDPVNRFEEDGPWPGCANPRQAAMTKWRLGGAHRNGAGRISSRGNTRGIVGGLASPADGPAISDFTQLKEIAQQAFAPGLGDRRDHVDLVLLQPSQWADATYDPIAQEVTRLVADANGLAVPLVLRHSPETDRGLTTLQRLPGESLRGVFGSLRIGSSGLYVEPITLWTEQKPVHLTLDDVPVTKATPVLAAEPAEREEEPESDEELPTFASPVGQLLNRVEADLLAIAEGGIEVMRDLSPLRAAAAECRALGLMKPGASVEALLDSLDQFRKTINRDPAKPAANLLQAAYLTRLASEWATVCLAVPA